jgi:hypothetical protein
MINQTNTKQIKQNRLQEKKFVWTKDESMKYLTFNIPPSKIDYTAIIKIKAQSKDS